MSDGVPEWARRIKALRDARGLSQTAAVARMREHSDDELPESDHLVRRWKAWERGDNKPSPVYAPLIAAALGTVTATIFPPEQRHDSADILAVTGMTTFDIVSRIEVSDLNDAALTGLRMTVDRLCSEYASQDPLNLIVEGRQWLRRMVEVQNGRLTFAQRRETLELMGWLALLVGCLEYDLGDRRAAEGTRQSALRIGLEVGSPGIVGWAHEMRAWFALTSNDYRGVIAAAETGIEAAQPHSVAVQLLAQQAKAYARMGRKDDMNAALERGRLLLDRLPYPENVENHFVVDPAKYDFYAMDCYRHVGEDKLARALADEVIRFGTDIHGEERSPMRITEARITLGVAAAREGDLEEALSHGQRAIASGRRSIPSLAMVSRDLTDVLTDRFPREADAIAYVDEIRNIQRPPLA
ncbi:helix-turn-helix domain-containing protein [Kutzneria kofuensis]|uniref:Tetratricopeptide (TPR) repeat protein n=1 Tax=Kutzneria kofuensis TaxID=103725 RepID=A0A7W9KHF3_9PSEU|nr:helix-turn-helix transcriptional regulator [Kutzneria kofuensis]MBB5892634.1 tetratricopeptide (TPR) repeat protein [Kutzneria kofuensis]